MRFNKKGGFNTPFCKKTERFSKSYITKICNQVKNIQNLINVNDYTFICEDFNYIINLSNATVKPLPSGRGYKVAKYLTNIIIL